MNKSLIYLYFLHKRNKIIKSKTNLNEIIYWILYVVIGLICYQILLISFAWLFGQSLFFKNFLKRFAKRMGFGKFIKG